MIATRLRRSLDGKAGNHGQTGSCNARGVWGAAGSGHATGWDDYRVSQASSMPAFLSIYARWVRAPPCSSGTEKAEEFGDLMQPAFAVGQILRGELSVHSIDDCGDTLILGRQVLIEGGDACQLGNSIKKDLAPRYGLCAHAR